MAAPATARVYEKQSGEWRRFWIGVAITACFNLLTVVYVYGRLSQQVEDLHESVQELRQDVRAIKARP